MHVPAYLVMAQWALLILLGLLIVIMFRQLGRLFNRASRPQATSIAGTRAPDFDYLRVSDNSEKVFQAAAGQPTLVAFVDPTCPSCEELVESLGAAVADGELPGFRVLLLTADPPSYLRVSPVFMSTPLELGAMTTVETRVAFDATATPLLVAIDAAGVIRAHEHVQTRAEVLRVSRASTLPPTESMIKLTSVSD